MRYTSGDASQDEEELSEASVKNGFSSSLGRIKIISGEEFEKSKIEGPLRNIGFASLILLPVAGFIFFKSYKRGSDTADSKSQKKKR